MKTNIKCH